MTDTNTENHVDFSVIREEFSKYKLENNIVLRLKASIMTIVETNNGKEIAGDATTDFITNTQIPDNFDTSKLQTVDPFSKPNKIKKLRIIQRKEIENIYETKVGFLTVSIHLKEVFLTDKKDINGIPILYFDHLVETSFVNKPPHMQE